MFSSVKVTLNRALSTAVIVGASITAHAQVHVQQSFADPMPTILAFQEVDQYLVDTISIAQVNLSVDRQSVTTALRSYRQAISVLIRDVRRNAPLDIVRQSWRLAADARTAARVAITTGVEVSKDREVRAAYNLAHESSADAFNELKIYVFLRQNGGGSGRFLCIAQDPRGDSHAQGHRGMGSTQSQARQEAMQACQQFHQSCTVTSCMSQSLQ